MAVAAKPVKVARRRREKKRAGLVLAGHGQGWSLWVPVDQWDQMTDAQRLDLANRQAALLDGRG